MRRPRPIALVVLVMLAGAATLAAKPGGHPRRRGIDALIIHSLGGPDCRDGATFYRVIDGDARTWLDTFARLPIVSIHYVIDREGHVAAGVPESFAATHATGWNQRSIGVELVNNGDGRDPFPAAQIEALVALARDIRARYPAIALSRVLRHSDVDHSTFPADTFGTACAAFRRKEDPGEAFPWDAFKAALAR